MCGHVVPTTGALQMHLRAKHQTSVGRLYGLTCPLCTSTLSSASGLGVHVGQSHPEVADAEGNASISSVFRYAWDQGDPHSIVAKMLAEHGLDAMPPRSGRATS